MSHSQFHSIKCLYLDKVSTRDFWECAPVWRTTRPFASTARCRKKGSFDAKLRLQRLTTAAEPPPAQPSATAALEQGTGLQLQRTGDRGARHKA